MPLNTLATWLWVKNGVREMREPAKKSLPPACRQTSLATPNMGEPKPAQRVQVPSKEVLRPLLTPQKPSSSSTWTLWAGKWKQGRLKLRSKSWWLPIPTSQVPPISCPQKHIALEPNRRFGGVPIGGFPFTKRTRETTNPNHSKPPIRGYLAVVWSGVERCQLQIPWVKVKPLFGLRPKSRTNIHVKASTSQKLIRALKRVWNQKSEACESQVVFFQRAVSYALQGKTGGFWKENQRTRGNQRSMLGCWSER